MNFDINITTEMVTNNDGTTTVVFSISDTEIFSFTTEKWTRDIDAIGLAKKEFATRLSTLLYSNAATGFSE